MTRQTELYDTVAEETASIIIRRYSTSFGLASRLLGKKIRQDVENIYGLVRVADEIVDGVAAAAGIAPTTISRLLSDFENETQRAMQTGFSANLTIHAFALTARRTNIPVAYVRAFFESMRMDITQKEHDEASFTRYVYGSAEVVGLMCLCSFLQDEELTAQQREDFIAGARKLGAAFQKVNFLRDLSADAEGLGRFYFPDVDLSSLTEADKDRLTADIDADLAISQAIVPKLPLSSRKAVALAQNLFAALNDRIKKTPANTLMTTRVSVPTITKARLAVRAWLLGK